METCQCCKPGTTIECGECGKENKLSKSHKTNLALLLTIFAVAAGIDVFLVLSKDHYTFSETIHNTLMIHPWLPFSIGVLVGHLVWPQIRWMKK